MIKFNSSMESKAGSIVYSQWEYEMILPLLLVIWQYPFIKSLFQNAFDSVILLQAIYRKEKKLEIA